MIGLTLDLLQRMNFLVKEETEWFDTISEWYKNAKLSRRLMEELLSPEAPPGMISAYRHLEDARALLCSILQGKDSPLILRRMRTWRAQEIEANLRAAFAEADSTLPLDVLANYLAGAQIALVQWWMERRRPHTPENLAQTFHRLQCAAIRDAFGLCDIKVTQENVSVES